MDKCREEFEKWLDEKNMFMNIERRFDQESNSYKYCAIQWIWESWQHQQAKVEEQAQEIANLKSLIQGHELRHQQNLSIKQKLTRRSEELQKRVDQQGLIIAKAMSIASDLQKSWSMFEIGKKLEQALKGNFSHE
ncbi:hypothetical protein [Acinetobacter phage HFM1]|nr:hypothetical protein [Acinetobacter phage HFM1]